MKTPFSVPSQPAALRNFGHHLFAEVAYASSLDSLRGALGCFGRAASSSTVTSSANGCATGLVSAMSLLFVPTHWDQAHATPFPHTLKTVF